MRRCEIARWSLLPQLRAHAEEVSGRRAWEPPRDPYGDPQPGGDGIFSPFYHWGTAGLGGPWGSPNSGVPLTLLGLPPALPVALGLKEISPTRSHCSAPPGSGHGRSDKIEGEGPPLLPESLLCLSHSCLSLPVPACPVPSLQSSPPAGAHLPAPWHLAAGACGWRRAAAQDGGTAEHLGTGGGGVTECWVLGRPSFSSPPIKSHEDAGTPAAFSSG